MWCGMVCAMVCSGGVYMRLCVVYVCSCVCVCGCVRGCVHGGVRVCVCVVVGTAFRAVGWVGGGYRGRARESGCGCGYVVVAASVVDGHGVLMACAVWFADFGVCGVVGSGGWWPGVVGMRVDGLWWCVRGVATYGVRDEGVSGYVVCGGVGGLPRRCCCLRRWALG